LVTVVPHTTSVRGTAYEIVVPANYLSNGAFDVLGLTGVVLAKLIQRLGALQRDELAAIGSVVRKWLAL
jgi:mRNA interferase MazF